MMDNLARKSRLILVQEREQEREQRPKVTRGIAADFIPELTDPPVGEGNRWWPLDGEHSRWVTSLGIVLCMYAAPLTWWLWPDNAPGASLPPPAAMVVELAPAPVAPPAPVDQPPGPEQAEATPPPEPEPVPEPEPELPPLPEAPEPEVALDPVEEPPLEEPEPEQEPPPMPEDAEPIEEPPPEEKPASSASAPPKAPEKDVQAAAPNQGISNPVVDRNRVMNWQSRLMMKLNKAKRYPSSARRSRQEGVVYLRFTMDRNGAVLAKSIERSGGYTLLDEETLTLIDRAQPLPKPPAEISGEQLEFVVPVEFFLNR